MLNNFDFLPTTPSFLQPFWQLNVVIDSTQSGQEMEFDVPLQRLTLSRVHNTSVTVFGDVGDIDIAGPADRNDVTVFGNVGGLVNFDGWHNDIGVYGDMNVAIMEDTIGTSLFAYSIGLLEAYDSRDLEVYSFHVDGFNLDGVDDSDFVFESTGGGEVEGDDNTLDLGFLFGEIVIGGGNGNKINVDHSANAGISIDPDAEDTQLKVNQGDVFVFDQGVNSHIRLGGGDDVVYAAGEDENGVTLVNGGGGNNVLIDKSPATIIASNFEFVSADTEGDLILLSTPGSGEVRFGNTNDGDFRDLMMVFGKVDGNDAVLGFNGGGSIRVVNGAPDFGLVEAPDFGGWDNWG